MGTGRTQNEEFVFVVDAEEQTAPKEPTIRRWQTGLAVLCVVILVGFPLGCRRSVKKQASKVTEKYYTGVDGSGYGISGDLDKIDEFCGNLITVANRYGQAFSNETQALTRAREQLASAETASEAAAAQQEAASEAQGLSLAMEGSGLLSEKDEEYRSELYSSIVSRCTIISHEAKKYNELVRKYNSSVLGSFPGSLFKNSVGGALSEYVP